MTRAPFLLGALVLLAAPLVSVDAQSRGLPLTVNDVGVGIGPVPRVIGIRINFRDDADFDVRGINITAWTPQNDLRGEVNGIALGLPATGASRITGLAAGIFGVGADRSIDGIGVGGLGLGAGRRLRGIMVGGLGVGSGGNVTGVALGGLGVGAGSDVEGISIGGLGIGSGGRVEGLAIGGLGVGSGEDLRGIAIGGVGVGAGERLTGLTIAGIGVGAGDDVNGITIAGVGVGSGGTLRWLSIAGVGVGAPRIEGAAIAPAVGASSAKALLIAPVYMRIEDGTFQGASVSAFNHVKGTQRGLTIGVFNYARSLHGVQLGVLNYAKSNRAPFRLLPIINVPAR